MRQCYELRPRHDYGAYAILFAGFVGFCAHVIERQPRSAAGSRFPAAAVRQLPDEGTAPGPTVLVLDEGREHAEAPMRESAKSQAVRPAREPEFMRESQRSVRSHTPDVPGATPGPATIVDAGEARP